MKRILLVIAVAAMLASLPAVPAVSGPGDADPEQDAVKKVIEAAYVKGIHIDRDVEAIRKGFHPSFTMFIYGNNTVTKWSIDEWIERIEEGKKKNPGPPKQKTTHEFSMVDVTGNAAVARIEIFKDGKHVFTDYMSLYKFEDGWKIVGKIYHRHG